MFILIMIQLSFWGDPPIRTVLAEFATKQECEEQAAKTIRHDSDTLICAQHLTKE